MCLPAEIPLAWRLTRNAPQNIPCAWPVGRPVSGGNAKRKAHESRMTRSKGALRKDKGGASHFA